MVDDSNIRTAVAAWLADPTAAKATYGHISTWETSGVTSMSGLFDGASSFNEDIGAWDTSSVTTMDYMFKHAWAFDQDLGWCVDDDVSLYEAFDNTQCASTSCGVIQFVDQSDCSVPRTGNVMVDWKIKGAVAAWLSNATAAEATYGHISTWATGGVTDMSYLFSKYINSGAEFFNEDIGSWAVHSVTDMGGMFSGASAFDQDLGWCVGGDVDLDDAFDGTQCASTLCGVNWAAEVICGGNGRATIDDGTIKTAVGRWLSNPAAAEASYGHISTWETGGVTDMSWLFSACYEDSRCNSAAASFNEDISAWDTSGVTAMERMFRSASAFNQDIGAWDTSGVTSMYEMFYRASALESLVV